MVETVERKDALSEDPVPISATEDILIKDSSAYNSKANAAGRALLEESNIIPLTSLEKKTTTKWELIWYYLYYLGKCVKSDVEPFIGESCL
jgi:hypothetical protein